MKDLDYNELMQEIIQILEKTTEIVLATCANDIVTGRTMNHVNDGLTIMFGTRSSSTKAAQIRLNKNVALICGPLQIEATAEFYGHPSKHAVYMQKNNIKFPWMQNAFPSDSELEDDSVLVICHPRKIQFYKYIQNDAHWDILKVDEHKACRV